MNRRSDMKKIISVFLSILTFFSLAGCKSSETAEDVYFLNFKPEIAEVYKKVAEEYEKDTGKRVKIVTAASGTYEQTLKSEAAKANPPTIFQVNGPIGYKAWKAYCADLSDTKLYDLLTDKSLAIKNGDGVYAIPYAIEGYGIIYNEEITDKYFALPGKKTSLSSMNEVNSFAKLKEVVEDMQANKTALGIEGTFASTSLSSGEQWRWQTHLANIPFYYELSEKNPDTDTVTAGTETEEIEFKYAENYKNLFDLYINNSVTDKKLLGGKSTSDAMAEFALGKCAMVQNGDWAWAQISEVDGNTVKSDRINFLPLYMGFSGEENTGLCVGTENYLAVNDKVSDEAKNESIAFLEWLFTSDAGKKYVTDELGFNAPFTSFGENETAKDPLAKKVNEFVNSGRKNIEWTFLSFPSEEFKNRFGDALLQYSQGNADWASVKSAVVENWKTEFLK